MKKLLVLVPVLIFLLTGYTYPSRDVYYIRGSGTLGNDVTVYFPYNQGYRFSIEGNSVINVYNASVTGYFGDNSVTFPTFNTPYYYPSTGSARQFVYWTEITDYRLPTINSPSNYLGEVVLIVGVLLFGLVAFKR